MALNKSTDSDFTSRVDTSDPTGYPYATFKNKNSTSSNDGTPLGLSKLWKDIDGFLQYLLTKGGITPSGVPDSATASDYASAIFNAESIGNDGLSNDLSLDKFSQGELNFSVGDFEFFFSPAGLTMYHGNPGVRKIIRLQTNGAGSKPTLTVDREGQSSKTVITNDSINAVDIDANEVRSVNVVATSTVSTSGGTENAYIGANTGLVTGPAGGLQTTTTRRGIKYHGATHSGISTIVRRSSTFLINSLIGTNDFVFSGTAAPDTHVHTTGQRILLSSTLDTGVPIGSLILGASIYYVGITSGDKIFCNNVELQLGTFGGNIGLSTLYTYFARNSSGAELSELIDTTEAAYLTIDYDASGM